MTIAQVSASELKTRIENEPDLFLLDVREPNEFEFACIENSVLIPLNQIPQRLAELDPHQEIVVICHHGVRSSQACMYLINSGFEHITNLSGGIDAWSSVCDNSVPRY
ncbi:MAG: rhodanese-like domain-containing protein [Methylobacter sp.]|nr:rhodanese-like domain-containing protein [Methylobacter sp.]